MKGRGWLVLLIVVFSAFWLWVVGYINALMCSAWTC